MNPKRISQIELESSELEAPETQAEVFNLGKALERMSEASEKVCNSNHNTDPVFINNTLTFLENNSEKLEQAFKQDDPDLKFSATSTLANYFEAKNFFMFYDRSYGREFLDLAVKQTEKVLEDIFKHFKNEPGYGSEIKLYFIFLEYAKNCSLEKKSKFINLFLESMETKSPYTDLYFVTEIYLIVSQFGNPEQSDIAIEKLLEIAKTLITSKDFTLVMSAVFKANQNKQSVKVIEIMDSFFSHYQLPNSEMSRTWILSTNIENLGLRVCNNIDRIIEVEAEQPGACSLLYKEFGIADFARYPKELLIKQAREINDTTKPYGLIIFPKFDPNGAFYSHESFEPILKETNGEFNLRAIECESKLEIAKLLIKMNKKYNIPGGQKISLLVLGGHGKKDKIIFGHEGPLQEINITDLQGMGIKKIGGFFEKTAKMVLISCKTGQKNGIGSEIEKQTGIPTIAPATDITDFYLTAFKDKKTGNYEFNAKMYLL